MKPNRQFIIPFRGLATGSHKFAFEIGDKFFDDFEESEISKGKVLVNVDLNKMANMLELDFKLSGSVVVTCDRCLDEFDMPVSFETILYVKFGDTTHEQTDEILIISHAEGELDLAQYIYEYIHLSLPYKRIHPNDKKGKSLCNKDMLKKLNKYVSGEHSDNSLNNLKNLLNQN